MKKNQLLGMTIGLSLFMISCEKNTSSDPQLPDTSGLSAFFDDNVSDNTQHFTVSATAGGIVTGAKGTTIVIYPGTLTDQSGSTVSGNVNVELIEVYDRATMVLLNKPTTGRLPNGDKSTLISKGEYFLRITQNGQALQTTGVIVQVPENNIPGNGDGMSLFNGEIEGPDLTWILTDTTIQQGADSSGVSNYTILDNQWGWTNVDRFYSDPRPKTVLKVKLPEAYSNTNAEVYLAYDGEPGALASLDVFTNDGYFSEHYGLIPIGLEVHFIAVTMINGELNYAIQGATITDGHIEYINSFTPATQAELAALINALP